MMLNFDLVGKNWVYCRTQSGEQVMLSLHDLFSKAHELKEITDNNPLTVAALHRLLLAIIHSAVDGPDKFPDWEALWQRKSFLGTPVLDYLEAKRDRFDLFSEQYPFYQTAGFTLDTTVTSQKLLHELATGNNKTIFDHNLDDDPAHLSPDQAARALLTAQMYSFGGGQGATSKLFGKHPNFAHAPLVLGALILIQGRNLFETLLLNLLRYSREHSRPIVSFVNDNPVWEQDSISPDGKNSFDPRPPLGYLEYLTWRSRHIRLLPQEDNGKLLVRHLYMAQGNIVYKDFKGDPMFAYGRDKEQLRFPIKLDTERSFWRNSAALFEFSDSQDSKKADDRSLTVKQAANLKGEGILPKGPLRCLVIGIANDKANPLCWRMEQLTVPSEILQDQDRVHCLKKALEWAEGIGLILRSQTRSLAQYVLAPDGRKADTKAVTRLASAFGTEAQYWARLDTEFRVFLSQLTDEALLGWYTQVKHTALNVFEETTRHYLSHTARELQAQAKATGWLGFEVGKAYKELNLKDAINEEALAEEMEEYS